MAEKDWLPYYQPVENPKVRLFAFHWAGGSASSYNGAAWRELPEGVEVLAVQLPGREKRGGERTPSTAQEAARLTVKALSRFFVKGGVPTAIFAHSMGTWVAFEFVRELRKQNLQLPELMIVSNLAAPQTEESSRPWRRNASLTEDQFKEECRAWGVNEIVMKDNFWKNYHLPFRRDFTIFDEYKYKEEDPLDTAVVCFLSAKDPRITRELMAPWSTQSKNKRAFELVDFPGDHFYVQDRKIVQDIVRKVGEYMAKVRDGGYPPELEPEHGGQEFLNEDVVRKINLLEILEEDYPDVDPPPEDCVEKWTEDQIRAHFSSA
ncbi:thioesterase [Chloropicon primus]|uniref:Thioesterase n=1 Tax=Chloropicon primus TaxID=1764295 RepID=A0A5B8MCA5_9CHLO|nr:thioesterase [Chloropicon primus]UPQ97228.1 thioesterase [Chloropicon primus]|eukprot:QDZ18013.1 thioesterase [Chloropicon primus]